MAACSCADYDDLELVRDQISKRSKQSKAIKSGLSQIAGHSDKEHLLLVCDACGAHWQRALAWNWGNIEYLFRVPGIAVDEWMESPFVDPDELLIWCAVLDRFLTQNTFAPSDKPCRRDGCDNLAIKMSVNCLKHHIESMQRIGNLAKTPTGRWFGPYSRLSPDALDQYVATLQPKA